MKTIVFVCHGNICRSVAAEYIAKKIVKEKGLEAQFYIFSRATSREEIGNDIYPPMKRELKMRGIPFESHSAQQITQRDYDYADYVFYMDARNYANLMRSMSDTKNIMRPITYFEKDISEIEDPWYTDN
ncbi:MAG: low molecular weight phosphotyrosine protein phosphatase, partial [Bacilli bacterium]|nr:low molecular weight phosphotyrosine protein phosphatase [Bacilli bacterium]